MKPDWDSLADEFASSQTVLIADVDCTADGKPLCEKYGVKGYPTIKTFAAGDTEGTDYDGGRDLEGAAEGALSSRDLVGARLPSPPSTAAALITSAIASRHDRTSSSSALISLDLAAPRLSSSAASRRAAAVEESTTGLVVEPTGGLVGEPLGAGGGR